MKVNWPEKVWVNSPLRLLVQACEIRFFGEMRPLPPGARCLEIGCGRGVGMKLIRRTFHPQRGDAIDIDPCMIDLAVRRFPRPTGDRGLLLVADAQSLPYQDACLDAVFNFGIIHHLEDWEEGVREIARVLVKGGAFYFEEIYPPLYANWLLRRMLVHPRENRFHSPEFHGALSGAGLRMIPGYRESRFGIVGVAEKVGE